MPEIYIEENGYYSIDCTAAVWSTNCIHDYYQDAGHKYGEIGFLKDTDFVIESDKAIYLVEYKNANVPGAAKPDAFRPEKDIILNKVAEKYFDTLHCLYLLGKNKPKKYIYVLEYPNGNSTSRLMMFYFTTPVQMKHFQCVVHKPECSIQTQVVILKVLMIKSSAVTEPR